MLERARATALGVSQHARDGHVDEFGSTRPGGGAPPGDGPDAVDVLLARWSAERPDVEAMPLAVLGRLHHAYVRYSTSARRVVAEFGLSMASFDILIRLRTAGAPYRMTAGGLAQSGFVSSGGI